MSTRANETLLRYLEEAHAMEGALARTLQEQILITPRGSYREGLENHLRETREHSQRVRRRMQELGRSREPLQWAIGIAESVIGQALALGKAPLDLLRGSGGEEKVLKNAKDACAGEALEIATYTALERIARDLGDEQTAKLAASILRDEQRMLERVVRELPALAGRVVRAQVDGAPTYELGQTGAAEAAEEAVSSAKQAVRKAESGARRTARKARRVPGVAQAEGELKGAVASEADLAIADYEKLTAAEVLERLPGLSQVDLAKVDAYERRHRKRSTVLSRIGSLRGSEPWPGYDEMSVQEIRPELREADQQTATQVRSYERSHKNRSGVLEEAQPEPEHATA
jgi:ferritin-like metal-binding protein YciE